MQTELSVGCGLTLSRGLRGKSSKRGLADELADAHATVERGRFGEVRGAQLVDGGLRQREEVTVEGRE